MAAVHIGPFIDAAVTHALIAYAGCEYMHGGTIVLSGKRGGPWQYSALYEDRVSESCHAVPEANGRDLLVCVQDYSIMGERDQWIYLLDFGARRLDVGSTILNAVDNTQTCAPEIRRERIEKIEFHESTLNITAIHGTLRLNEEEQRACRARTPEVPVERVQIEYRLARRDGRNRFQPAPASVAAASRFPSDLHPFQEAGMREAIQAIKRTPAIPPQGDTVDAKTRSELLAAGCGGKTIGDECDSDPVDGVPGKWKVRSVRFGHFRSPASEDAIVTTTAFWPNSTFDGGSMLLTRRNGNWEPSMGVFNVGLDIERCHKLRFRSGKELLVCENSSADYPEAVRRISAVFAEGTELEDHEIFAAHDGSVACFTGHSREKAAIEKIEFHDVNGDGWEDLSITALHGAAPPPASCDASSRKAPALTRYTFDVLFDGQRFQVAQAQRELVKRLFSRPD